ncbi:MAG: alpha/beta fold hydrolase [Myxococcota bacterium]
MGRLRGLKALVHDAVDATTDLVGEGHASASRAVDRVSGWIGPSAGPVLAVDGVRRLATAGVLGAIRAVNRGIETATDAAMDLPLDRVGQGAPVLPSEPNPPVPLRSDALGSGPWIGDALLGAVNGAVGDHLHRRANGLDLGSSLRPDPARIGPRLAVFVHGLGTTEWSWSFEAARFLGDPAATFGTLLHHDLGFSPVYARYNTGRRVSDNGALLAAELERLIDGWPVPVEELVLIGHSMGGLVVRAAGLSGQTAGHRWVSLLTRVVCLGSPHQGAGLERLAAAAAGVLAAIDHPATRIPAAVLDGRSAGILDLGIGDVTGDATADTEHTLLPGVTYGFVAGSVTTDPNHPVSRVIGDLLVQVGSASGPARVRAGAFTIETARFGGIRHHHLQVHPDVYAHLRGLLER